VIILHCSIDAGRLFLWGEVAGVQRGRPRKRAQPRAKSGAAVPVHPRVAGIPEIGAALDAIGANVTARTKTRRIRVIWLPARDGEPYPSSPALGVDMPVDAASVACDVDMPAAAARATHGGLQPFLVTTQPIGIDDALDPALRESNEALAGSGVLLGPSVEFCVRVTQLALRAARLQAFLPGLARREDAWEARWRPCLGDAQQRELLDLAAAMPAVCRCMGKDGVKPPRWPAVDVTGDLLATALDTFVRWGCDGVLDRPAPRRMRAFASIHDAWLTALSAEDPRLAWDADEDVRNFLDTLERWARAARVLSDAPFSLCFRLSEPDAPARTDEAAGIGGSVGNRKPLRAGRTTHADNAWTVEYFLQPKADPSLQLPLAALWDRRGVASQHLESFGSHGMEFTLTALGQAAGICPAVAASLRSPDPGGFMLDAQGAWQFLRVEAAVLQRAGFPVLLPSWWTGGGRARRITARVAVSSSKSQGGGGGLDSIVAFDVKASLGGEALSLDELRALARLKAPLVQLRGEWTHVDPDQIAAALRAMKDGAQGTMRAREALSLALGGAGSVAGLPVESVQLDGWLDALVGSLTRREELAELPQPEDFAGTLRPYQLRGFSWLAFLRRWGLGSCLADDMGLGKTIQTLALLQRERLAGETRPALLICPTSVIGNWRREAAQFTPSLSVMVHHGVDRRRRDAFAGEAGVHALVVSSYGLLQRDVEFLRAIEWSALILDEAQNIKNPETKQSKAARTIRAEYRIALTGTPVENHVGDLWSIMDVLNPGLLGSRASFVESYQRPIHVFGDEDATARLRAITGPFILRRMKTDRSVISDLPEKIEMKEYCTLTREQASLYQAVLDEMQETIEDADGIQRRGMVLATLSKLKQVCNHPAQFLKDGSPLPGRSGKLARLEELLRDIRGAGERSLVFTQFAEMGEALQQHLRERFGEEVLFLHGGVPRKRRDEMVRRFQHDDGAPGMFVLSLKAGGTGLNLTRANHVLHYDRWWNPAVEDQATDRAFRIGQQRNVMVHRFIVSGTLEEFIDDMIERKSDVARRVVGTGEQWLTELSNQDLFALLRLGADAVGEDGIGTT
jgi:superfamily II DNA or RNA helicase